MLCSQTIHNFNLIAGLSCEPLYYNDIALILKLMPVVISKHLIT